MRILGLILLITSFTAFAGFEGFQAGVSTGLHNRLNCSTGMTCTRGNNGVFTMTSSPTLTADLTLSGTTPYLTIGDAGAEDAGIVFDGHSGGVDWNISSDDSVDKLVIGLGSAAGTTNRMAFNSTGLNIVLGDASAADMSLVWDGNAQDFNIGLDDSTDDLVIGLGSAPGTTDAIRIDENQDVTIVQNLVGLGTDSMSGFLQKHVAATAVTITAAQCGSTFANSGAVEMDLPEASTVIGCRLTFVTANASNFDVDPDAADQILVQTDAAGDKIRNATLGNTVTIQAISASQWVVVGILGTWADAN